MELKPLITIFFFFILVAGIVIIYHEEILKMEYFGRLQTTAVPKTVVPSPTQPGTPVRKLTQHQDPSLNQMVLILEVEELLMHK